MERVTHQCQKGEALLSSSSQPARSAEHLQPGLVTLFCDGQALMMRNGETALLLTQEWMLQIQCACKNHTAFALPGGRG